MTIFLNFFGSAQIDPGSQLFLFRKSTNPVTPKNSSTNKIMGTRSVSNFDNAAAPDTPRMVRISGPTQHRDAIIEASMPPPTSHPDLFSILAVFILLPLLFKAI